MARTQSYVPWTLERRVDLPPRRMDPDVPGKKEIVVRHGDRCSLLGTREGGTPAAAGAVEREVYRGVVAGGKKVPSSASAGGEGVSSAFNATAKVASQGSTKGITKKESAHSPLLVKPEAVLPATVRNWTGSLHPIPKGQGSPPAFFRPTVRVAPPRKRTSAPYDLATRLVMVKRCARKTNVRRKIVPEANTGFAADGRDFIEALSLTKGQKRGSPFLSLELGGCFLQKKPKLEAVDPRRTLEELLREFRDLTVKLQRQNVRKPHMEAFKSLKASGRTPGGKYLGEVPGVEVGDEFYYRTELMVAGVHGSPFAGIDSVTFGGEKVASCVVSHKFKGYVNLMTDGDVLVYSGAGGNPFFESTRKGRPRDQRLVRGNRALKNSMVFGTPVRVVHGCRVDDGEPPEAETNSTVKYIYDGLYVVEHIRPEKGATGFTVLKFHMRRLPGQRKLELKQVLRGRAAGSELVLRARAAGSTQALLTAADQTGDLDTSVEFESSLSWITNRV